MIKYIAPIAAVVLLSSGAANANQIKSSNQAVTACKTHIKSNVDGYKRAKLGKVRSSRDSHLVTFSVSTEEGRNSTKCVVNKDTGAISLLN